MSSPEEVRFLSLNGVELKAALCRDEKSELRLENDKALKYFKLPTWFRGATPLKDYHYHLAVVKTETPGLWKIVSIIGTQVSPYDSNVLWLSYLSTSPAYQRRGYLKQTLNLLKGWLADKSYVLHRSTPSDEGREKVTTFITAFLDSNDINWTSTELENQRRTARLHQLAAA